MMVNLVNLMRMTGRCLPMMKESKHGAVITISSLAATVRLLEISLKKYFFYCGFR